MAVYKNNNGVAELYATVGGSGGGGAAINVEKGYYDSDYTYHYVNQYSHNVVIAEVFGCITQLTIEIDRLEENQTFTRGYEYKLMELNTQDHRDILSLSTYSAKDEGVCDVTLYDATLGYWSPTDVVCKGHIASNGDVILRFAENYTVSTDNDYILIRAIFINRRSTSAAAINLGDLGNVTLTSPTAGQGLVYDATNQRWINGAVSGGGGNITRNIYDVTDRYTTPSSLGTMEGFSVTAKKYGNVTQMRFYIQPQAASVTLGTAGTHTNPYIAAYGAPHGDAIDNIVKPYETSVICTIYAYVSGGEKKAFRGNYNQGTATGGLLQIDLDGEVTFLFDTYSGFVADVVFINNATLESGGGSGSSALNDLSDVVISSPEYGQSLVYDNGSQKWINGLPQVIRRNTTPNPPSSLQNAAQAVQMLIYGRYVQFIYRLYATSGNSIVVNADYEYAIFSKTDEYDTPYSSTWDYPFNANIYFKDNGLSGAVATPLSGTFYYDGGSLGGFRLLLNESVTLDLTTNNKSIVVVGSFINSAL